MIPLRMAAEYLPQRDSSQFLAHLLKGVRSTLSQPSEVPLATHKTLSSALLLLEGTASSKSSQRGLCVRNRENFLEHSEGPKYLGSFTETLPITYISD